MLYAVTTTPLYAAFLGNHPSLSIAELAASVPDFAVVRMIGTSIALFKTSKELTNKDLTAWGGIFLMAREIPTSSPSLDAVPNLLVEQVRNVKGKVTFSVRTFGIDRAVVHRLYRDCKHRLKDNGMPSRYIGNERQPPVSAQLRDTGIVDGKHGCEMVILADDEEEFLWIGKTVAAQDPDSYTKRDMHKPVRDTRAGLLPPKLAQILLNLGRWIAHEMNPKLGKTLTVFDPFCGTGVIPMETLLRGWHVLASDMSLKAVNGCEKNLEWLRKEFDILKRDTTSDVWKQDATKPFELKDKPDVIVTETMLGPALSDRPTGKDAAKNRSECDALEIAFLKNAAATLPGVPVVAMFPVWYVKAGPVRLERVWKELDAIGYRAILPNGAQSDALDRPSITYRRADQFVGREIVILKPKK